MNKKQQQAIESFKRGAWLRGVHGRDDDYEFKRWEVTELSAGGIVMVIAEIGLKGDESTLASIFARDKFQVFFGLRGGMSAYNDNGKRVRGRKIWRQSA